MSPENLELLEQQRALVLKAVFDGMTSPSFLDMKRAIALEKMVAYKAYVAAGFTETQAIELCKGN